MNRLFLFFILCWFFERIHLYSAVQLNDDEVLRRKAARKKTAASYYKRYVIFESSIADLYWEIVSGTKKRFIVKPMINMSGQ